MINVNLKTQESLFLEFMKNNSHNRFLVFFDKRQRENYPKQQKKDCIFF